MIPRFATTAIGSLPFKEIDPAVELHLNSLDIPCWPQLPRSDFGENMYLQFSHGLPGLAIEGEGKKVYLDKASDEDLLRFFQAVTENDLEYFSIRQQDAVTLYAFKEKLEKAGFKYVKGQITGPVSLGLSLKTADGRPLLYDDQWREIITQHLKMKALWQYGFLKRAAENAIIFIDEPYLSSLGSGYVTISEKDVQSSLGKIVQALKEAGAITGIHCCGNTDWASLLQLSAFDLNIISFDAYDYFQSLLTVPDLVELHLREIGNYIAWGIVPANEKVMHLNPRELSDKMKQVWKELENKGVSSDLIRERSLLTPSCGTATLQEDQARMVYQKLEQLQEILSKD